MQLTQTKQCANCPWKVNRDLSKIPDYNRENHEALQRTIADPSLDLLEQLTNSNVAMGCHYSTDEKILECVGWIYHQIRNNNLHFGYAQRIASATGIDALRSDKRP